ncbi:MAG: amino acid adenylation domain-containing protein, partial [Actinomycetota bacterium]|nr:amino acid adenylation domain-containing protein [Actinomycetota bacterium]
KPYRAPETDREQALCGLFAEVLGVPRVGLDDSFFDLGGHSLLASRLLARIRTALGADLELRSVFDQPTPAGLAGLAAGSDVSARPALTRRQAERVPLSYAQRRLWFLQEFAGGSAYNVCLGRRLSGEFDVSALRAALAAVVDRHDTLRTLVEVVDGEPFQRVVADAQPELTVAPYSPELLAEASAHCFDLANELPIRAWLLDDVLLLVIHHVAADGWSLAPLMRDLSTAYAARLAGTEPSWAALPVRYADYTLWQAELLGDEADESSVVSRQLRFWRETLAGVPAELGLPHDRPVPVERDGRGGRVGLELDAELFAAVTALARAYDVTLFMVLHAVVVAVLSRLGGGVDVPVGAGLAGRGDEVLDELVGFFVNTVVLRTDLSGDPSFGELLGRVREVNLAAHANGDVPFDRLVDVLGLDRSAARHPLFQVMLVLQNNRAGELELPDVEVSRLDVAGGSAKFDLTLHFTETGRALTGGIEYAIDVFDEPTVTALAERIVRVLQAAAERPETRLSALPVVLPDEVERLSGFNATGSGGPAGTIPALFARREPDGIAVVDGDRVWTYAELDRCSNRVAHWLLARGVGAETPVAVAMERSADLVAALLGVAKAGGVFVPLHPQWSQERVARIVEQAGVSLTLTEIPQDGPDTDPGVQVLPDQLVYVMYTSGSTGEPKGVAVRHRDVAALVADSCFDVAARRAVLAHSPHSFDASTFELWVPLLSGGRVVVAPADAGVDELAGLIARSGVSAVWLTAGLFAVIAEEHPECFAAVAQVWAGGDVVSSAAVRRVQAACPGTTVVNGYGPTETTTFATHYRMPVLGDEVTDIPIGRPLDGVRAYVLDERLGEVPPGVAGELYLAGAGLARGYLHRPGVTAERFVASPFHDGERLYRTGDLARWTAAGLLSYLGRADDQVKVRGFRIELGEIEAVLAAHPAVAQAVVVVRESAGAKQLIGYVVAPSAEGLREYLAERLPEYMVPAVVVALKSLPLNDNGKVDRRALPEPVFATAGHRAPGTEREAALRDVFAQVLGLESVGVTDSFFDLGGDSIMAIQLVSRARAAGVSFSARDVFRLRTVEALAAVEPAGAPVEQDDGVGVVPLTPVMKWFLGPLTGFYQSMAVPVPDGADVHAAVQALVDRHDMLRLRVDGSTLRVLPVGAVQAADVVHTDAAAVRLAPEDGVVVQAVWAGGMLRLVVHHYAVDGVSWRILLPDLTDALQGRALAPVPVSFRRWAEHLHAADRSGELDWWRQVL